MNATPNTRNASRIRSVLVQELVEEYVGLWLEHEEPEVLHAVLMSRTHQHRIAKRLQIGMPESSCLVGRIVSKAHICGVRARKEANAS